MSTNMKCGFIGLGSQGGPMAGQMIDKGYDVTLWARRPEAFEQYAGKSFTKAASAAKLGAASEHVGVCVIDDAGVKDICAELIPAMKAGSRIAIHSTIHPQTCIDLAKQAAARGISVIDAPVSGGGPGAAAGTLTVMVGGDAEAFALAKPVFETFGKLIVHLGGVGAAQNAKLINNSLMAAHMGLAHQAVEASKALGLDRAAFIELVKASSGRSFGFETYARLPTPQAFTHGAPLLAKDVRLLVETLGDAPPAEALRAASEPFLSLAQGKTQ